MTVKLPHTIKAKIISRVGTPVAVFSIIVVLSLGVLAAIPVAVKQLATSWLLANGMAEVRIDNIDINPFIGRFALEGVELRSESGERSSLERFSLNLALTELLKKRIRIQTLQVKGLNLVVGQGEDLTLGGLTLPADKAKPEVSPGPQEAPAKPWLIGIDSIEIAQTTLALSLPRLALRLDLYDLSLSALHAWNPEENTRLEIEGAIDRSPLLISLDLTPFASAPAVQGSLYLKGFALDRLHRMAEPQITALRGELTIETRITLSHKTDGNITFNQTGTLSLLNLGGSLKSQGVDLSTFNISWLGDLWVTLDPKGALTDLRSLGRLSNTKLAATLSPMRLALRHEGLIWDGEIRLRPPLDKGLTARGNIRLTSASATDTQNGEILAALSSLFVYDIEARGLKSIRTPHISIEGIEALPPLARIGSLDLTGLALRDIRHLSAETIIANRVAATLRRDAAGELTFLEKIETQAMARPHSPPTEEPVKTEENREPPFTVRIETFRIKGEKFLQFTDESVTPAFKKTIHLKRLELLGIDTSAPEKEIPLTLEIELDPYETISVAGTLEPFSPEITAHLNLNITNIDLASLSPYSTQTLGYLIETGTFTTKTRLNIDAGNLDLTNAITLHNLELIPDEKEKIERLMKTLTMPLDFALSILKDKNDTISLSVPVTGDIHNPDISLQSVINKAMAKAVTSASVSYLKFLIQPYGTILTVVQKVGEYAAHIRLDPVVFEVGAILPSREGLDYLKMVAGVMREKEVLKLTICANAVTEDIKVQAPVPEESVEKNGEKLPEPPSVDPALYIELARQRIQAIRHAILADGDIDPSRIILCNPHFTPSEEERPEATLSL